MYSLQDLIGLRTILRLVRDKVPATRLRYVLQRLAEDEALNTKKPLVELRLQSLGGEVVRFHQGSLFEPATGQQIMDLDVGAAAPQKVHSLHIRSEREWLQVALEAEREPARWDEARAAYQQVLTLAPDYLEAYINLGTLQFKMGQLTEAEAAYRDALARDSWHPVVRFNLANVLDELNRPQEALMHLQAAVRLRSDYADAHFNLALLLEKLGRTEDARNHWQAYLRLDPDSEWSHLARRHLGLGEPHKPAVSAAPRDTDDDGVADRPSAHPAADSKVVLLRPHGPPQTPR